MINRMGYLAAATAIALATTGGSALAAFKPGDYRGPTKQQDKSILFKASKKKVSGLYVTFSAKCSDGTTLTTSDSGLKGRIRRGGKFTAKHLGLVVKGRLKGTKAKGTLHFKSTANGKTCDTGRVGWSAELGNGASPG
jgi:hypothetical protein